MMYIIGKVLTQEVSVTGPALYQDMSFLWKTDQMLRFVFQRRGDRACSGWYSCRPDFSSISKKLELTIFPQVSNFCMSDITNSMATHTICKYPTGKKSTGNQRHQKKSCMVASRIYKPLGSALPPALSWCCLPTPRLWQED
jgi:hypothetical protein